MRRYSVHWRNLLIVERDIEQALEIINECSDTESTLPLGATIMEIGIQLAKLKALILERKELLENV